MFLSRRGDAANPPAPAPVDAAAVSPVLAAVLDHLSVGVVLCDEHGGVTLRNRAAERLAGTQARLLVDEAVERLLQRAVDGEDGQQLIELFGPPKLVVVVSASQLPDRGAVAAIEDVSERSRLDAVRTDFVANISHELKTPVGALAVLAEALVDETDADVVSRVAGRMVDESHRATRTIDDLLELSRIELGGQPLHDSFAALDVVAGAVDRAHGLAERRQIRIAVAEIADDVRLSGDLRQLTSALGNLVENAVKYSDRGQQIDVAVHTAGGWVEFQVSDRGIGIPARDLDRIFERFYRVDKGRSRDTGGTGLGLAIVRHVAANHGGEVRVTSQEGEGSTFTLRIPERHTTTPDSVTITAGERR
jgi:two-component system sensor histidine kinase SenX3